MAEKYHILPSEVQERGTYFDIMADDIKTTYDQYHKSDAAGRAKLFNDSMDPEDMKAMMAKARGNN